MTNQPSVDEAVQRAMRVQDAKIDTIRELARGRQTLADTRADAARRLAELERDNAERIGAAERDDNRRYTAATKAGWTTDELRKIGFDEPAKARRVTQRRRATTTQGGSTEKNTPDSD